MKEKFKEYMNEFLYYIEHIRGYSDNTVSTYETALKKAIELSDIRVDDGIIVMDVLPLRMEISNMSKRTIAKYISSIHSFAKWLKDIKQIDIKLRADDNVKVPSTIPKAIDKNYIEEVFEDADILQKALLSVLYGAGLRISEVSHIKVEDVQGDWLIVQGKGDKQRQIPLHPKVKESIDRYIDTYNPKKWLFEKKKRQMSSHQLGYLIKKIFKAKGISASPHKLRHSFATEMLQEGARLTDLQKLLGHESIATTQIYTKLADSKKMQDYLSSHPLASSKKNLPNNQ